MIQRNDLILILMVFVSIGVGIAFPEETSFLQPYPLYMMMTQLFLSFMKIDFGQVLRNVGRDAPFLLFMAFFKLIVTPVILFLMARAFWPSYALPVLLLSGISTGVVAPFIADLLEASMVPVLFMVVVTSLFAPFTLPALVSLLADQALEISFLSMVKILSMVIFTPTAAVSLMRRFVPAAIEKLEKVRYPVSVSFFALINIGIFSKYSSFFRQNPLELAGTLVVAFLVSIFCHGIGFAVAWRRKREERLAGAVSFAYMNNVLVAAFTSEHFGPLAPALAVIYMFPFFGMIVPARIVARRIPISNNS